MHPGRARSGALVLIAALATGACTAGHASPGGAPPSGPGPTAVTTLAAGTSTTGTPTGAGPTSYRWSRSASPALDLGGGASGTIAGVLPPGPGRGWLAVGSRTSAAGASTAFVWTSADGTAWSGQPLAGADTSPASQAEGITTWHTSVAVVGSVGHGPDERAAVWVSPSPGAPFAPIPLASPAGSAMTAVTGGTLGLFAVGTDAGQPALWSSTNGQRWTLSTSATRVMSSGSDARVNTVLTTDTAVYAAGSVRSGGSTDAALWMSGDGLNWHPVSTAAAAFAGTGDRVITGLAPLGTGLVAVGGVRAGAGAGWAPASWISPEGVSWSQPSEAFPLDRRPQGGGTDAIARAVVAVPTLAGTSELFAVGGDSSAQRLWTSVNGTRWTEVDLPPPAARSTAWQASLVASDGTTVVVGDSQPGQPHLLARTGRGWSEPSGRPAVFGAVQAVARPVSLVRAGAGLRLTAEVDHPAQIVGAATRSTAVLVSADGIHWAAAPAADPAAAPSLPSGATASGRTGGRWVAVGQVLPGPAAPGPTAPAGLNPAGLAVAWTSTDGTAWQPARPLDSNPGIGIERPQALCTRGATTVVVGAGAQAAGGSTALGWWSADGIRWHPAPVSPAAPPGVAEQMTGCLATATGFVAFGAAAGPGGDEQPALWQSTDGSRWVRRSAAGFDKDASSPLTGLAGSGSTWVAVEAPDGLEPVAGIGPDAMPLAGPAGDQRPVQPALWRSGDAGTTWARLATGAPAWSATDALNAALVAFAGPTVVIAGQVDGRLAVWTGAASATGPAAG